MLHKNNDADEILIVINLKGIKLRTIMKKPKISIIVPVFNIDYYLNKCIQSIVDQTYINLEIIIIDDGSYDNSPFICDEWAQKDNRIIVIHKENGGLSDARNTGLEIASGEYIGFVDGDDWIAPEMIEKLLKAILNDKSDIAACITHQTS